MGTLVATVATVKLPLPAGVAAAGNYAFALFSVGNTTPVATQTSVDPTATFIDVTPGDYTIAVRRLSDVGDPITDPISSQPVTVPPVSAGDFDAPTSITVSVS